MIRLLSFASYGARCFHFSHFVSTPVFIHRSSIAVAIIENDIFIAFEVPLLQLRIGEGHKCLLVAVSTLFTRVWSVAVLKYIFNGYEQGSEEESILMQLQKEKQGSWLYLDQIKEMVFPKIAYSKNFLIEDFLVSEESKEQGLDDKNPSRSLDNAMDQESLSVCAVHKLWEAVITDEISLLVNEQQEDALWLNKADDENQPVLLEESSFGEADNNIADAFEHEEDNHMLQEGRELDDYYEVQDVLDETFQERQESASIDGSKEDVLEDSCSDVDEDRSLSQGEFAMDDINLLADDQQEEALCLDDSIEASQQEVIYESMFCETDSRMVHAVEEAEVGINELEEGQVVDNLCEMRDASGQLIQESQERGSMDCLIENVPEDNCSSVGEDQSLNHLALNYSDEGNITVSDFIEDFKEEDIWGIYKEEVLSNHLSIRGNMLG